MHYLATDVQVPGNRTLAEPLTMQREDLLIPSQAIGATDLPTLLCNSQRARSCCWSLVLRHTCSLVLRCCFFRCA